MVGYNTQQLNINNLLSAMAMMVIVVMFFRMVNRMLFPEKQKLLPATEGSSEAAKIIEQIEDPVIRQLAWDTYQKEGMDGLRRMLEEYRDFLKPRELPQTEKKPKYGLWDGYSDPKDAYAEARRMRQLGWQVRVTEAMTPQGRKFRVWVRKELPEYLPQTRTYYTVSFQGDTTFKPGEIVSEQAFKAENERVMKLALRPARGWITSKGELLSWGNGWRPVKELEEYLPATERGELLVRYTGGPQRFAFPEGLEGEIRNFAGHDWVILDTLRNREIIRKSRQWTIARQQPPHLKKSPDLLPSTAYIAEEIFRRAKEYFGITTNPDEAGYILPDGTMLDFSGRHYEPSAPISGPFRERMADHREIAFAWPEDDSPGGFDAMAQVMNWGAIRFSTFHETVVVNLIKPPTEPQVKAIKRALWYNPDAVLVVEVDTPELDQIDYREFTYPFTNWRAFVETTVVSKVPMVA